MALIAKPRGKKPVLKGKLLSFGTALHENQTHYTMTLTNDDGELMTVMLNPTEGESVMRGWADTGVHQNSRARMIPDFQSPDERDQYFRDHADYYTLVRKAGVGVYDRSEFNSVEAAEKAAQTRQLAGATGWMIYAIIGEQSAFVKAIK